MTLNEAVAEVKKAAKRSGYEGELTQGALDECARVYLDNCDADGSPRPRCYMRSGATRRPTNLSEIQWLLVRTPSFRRWFGKSVIVDENGDPKVMYHGAWQHFNEFKTSFIKLSKTAMTLWSGPGFYFTDQEKVAKIYAGGGNDRIYDVFLRLENPLVVDETGNAVNGRGIAKKDAERIFLDGDNTQWLDSGLANELAKMDQDEGVKGRGKPYYKAMTREHRVREFVSRLKTDVVTLKTAAQSYAAKSQNRLMHAICAHTGHDGVIHTLTPDVKEWVIYDPKAIKAANSNDGEFSTAKAKTEDSAVEKQSIGDNCMANLIESLKKIACDCADPDNTGYKAVMDSLSDIRRQCGIATDAIDPEGKWITVHPNGSKEGEGRPIHLDKGGNIDSEGHLSNVLKGKSGSETEKVKSEPPKYKFFNDAAKAVEYIQDKGKSYINAVMSPYQMNEVTAAKAASALSEELFGNLSWPDRMKKRDEIKKEMMQILFDTGAHMKNGWVIDDEFEEKKKQEEAKVASTMTGAKKTYFEQEGQKHFNAIESAIAKAKESGKSLSSRFEVNDYEDADEHYYHAMMNLVTKFGGKVLYQDSPEYDDEEGASSYGYARGFTATFPPDVAHELFTRITVNDGFHGGMMLPKVAK